MCIKILTLTLCICPHRDNPSLCPHAANLRFSASEILDEPFTSEGWATRLPTVLQGHIDWKFSDGETRWEHCPAFKARHSRSSDSHGGFAIGKEDTCPQTRELVGKLERQWTRIVRRLCEECENGHGMETSREPLSRQHHRQRQAQQHKEMSGVASGKQPVKVEVQGFVATSAPSTSAGGRRVSMIPTVGGRDRVSQDSSASKITGVKSDEPWIKPEGSRGRTLFQRRMDRSDANASRPAVRSIGGNMMVGTSTSGRTGLARGAPGTQKRSQVGQKKEWR